MAPIDDNADGDNEVYDETPTFIDMNSAVEVDVPDYTGGDDDDAMMDEAEMMADDDEALVEEKQAASASTGPVVDASRATFRSHTDSVYAVASHYDATSRTLSIASGGGDDRAYLHRLTTSSSPDGELSQATVSLSHAHGDSVSCVAFNAAYVNDDVSGKPQRSLVAAGSYDGSVALYDFATGELVHFLEGPTDVEFVSFHPKGGTVLLAGSVADGTVWMFHAPTKRCMQVFVGHEGGVVAGGFTPDGKWAVSAGRDGTLRVWAPKTGKSRHVFRLMESGDPHGGDEPGPGLTCLALGGGKDGQLAVCGGEDGNAHIAHVQGKKVVATLHHFEESPPAGGGGGGGMEGDEDSEEGEARSVEAVGFCPPGVPGTGGWCATGGVDGVLKVWNTDVAVGGGGAQLRQRCVRPSDGPMAGITRLRWHSSLPFVVCSYTDGGVVVWDARTGALTRMLTGHGDMINDMDVVFAEQQTAVVVTGSDDKTVKVFEYCP